MRHAKSSWDKNGLDDFDRTLLQKGIDRTLIIADALKKQNIIPDQIVCSPAVRALNTAEVLLKHLDLKNEIILRDRNLYFQGEEDYFNVVFATPDQINTLLIIGHNPMITSFSNYFLLDKIDNLPTSGLIGIEFQKSEWSNFLDSTWISIARFFPKKMNI